MSARREPVVPLPPEDNQFAALLSGCQPVAATVDSSRLMFEAGRASVLADNQRTTRFWQAACGLSAAAAVLAILAPLYRTPAPERPSAAGTPSNSAVAEPVGSSEPPAADPGIDLAALGDAGQTPRDVYLTQRRLAIAFGIDSLPLPTSARSASSASASSAKKATRVGNGISRGRMDEWSLWSFFPAGDNL